MSLSRASFPNPVVYLEAKSYGVWVTTIDTGVGRYLETGVDAMYELLLEAFDYIYGQASITFITKSTLNHTQKILPNTHS